MGKAWEKLGKGLGQPLGRRKKNGSNCVGVKHGASTQVNTRDCKKVMPLELRRGDGIDSRNELNLGH